MIKNDKKISARRGFFLAITMLISLLTCTKAAATSMPRSYWERLLHVEHGQSRVQSNEFFITEHGRTDPEHEQQAFIKRFQSTDGQALACHFPARYKWLKSQFSDLQNLDLTSCADLQAFLKSFKHTSLHIAYVSEFLDAPASAFGHLMLVFHDKQQPLDLADTIHFAAETHGESAFQYVRKGLTGGFTGYFLREPFFNKKKDYLLLEQRAIHLYEIDLTEDELLNITLHLFELRKAKFKYYFIDENCAFQVAELINLANPESDFSLSTGQAILPIDVIQRHANHIRQRTVLPPTIVREKYLTAQLTQEEKTHVQAVTQQREEPGSSESDQVKELLSLHYQYAFRRKRTPYPNHAQVDALDFQESTQHLTLSDPSQKKKSSTFAIGPQQSARKQGLRMRWTPLGDGDAMPNTHIERESQLNVLDSTVDFYDDRTQLHRVTLLAVSSTPNALSMHRPWSWRMGAEINRDNAQKDLMEEVEIGAGKTWMTEKLRVESWVTSGVQHHTNNNAYLKTELRFATSLQPNLQMSLGGYKKHLTHTHVSATELEIQYRGIQLRRRITNTRERSLLVNIPF